MKLMGHAGSNFASVGEGNFHFVDSLERYSFRNTLARRKWDVERSSKWLDSGLSPCACGLLGPAPKPPNAAHCDRKPIVAGPVGALSYKAKRKAKKGFVGSQPKVFKPIVGKQGLGQPKSPGSGPKVVSARNDKGKAKLVYEDPRPKLFSKPILGKRVTVQPVTKRLRSSLLKELGADLKQVTGMGSPDELTACTSTGGSTTVSHSRVAIFLPFPTI